jgi:hypothetical protein
MLKADWAYDFACDQPIEAILDAFNAASPWQWGMRDRLHWGDYLSCRPKEGVQVRVLKYPKRYGVVVGFRDKSFKALLEIEAASMATQSEIDDVFRRSLQAINATNVTEAKPYD